MSTTEQILSRMMDDHAFAESIFADAESALAEYDLFAEEIAKFKSMSRADFEGLSATSPEERKSMGRALDTSSPLLYNVLTNNENV